MAEAITIARPYAVAAFRLAKEKNALANWSDMLNFVAQVVANEQMKAYIDDPKVNAADIEKAVLTVANGKVDEQVNNLIKLLVEYRRLTVMPDIAAAFDELKAQDEGVLEAEITAASQPSDADIAGVVKRLEAKFGKKVEASVKVDPELLGGIKIVVGDTVIDASVRGQLQQLAYTLKG